MALPRKMTLVRSGEDIRLRMMPVENFLNARKLVYEDNTCELKYKPKDTVAIQIQLVGRREKISYVAENKMAIISALIGSRQPYSK